MDPDETQVTRPLIQIQAACIYGTLDEIGGLKVILRHDSIRALTDSNILNSQGSYANMKYHNPTPTFYSLGIWRIRWTILAACGSLQFYRVMLLGLVPLSPFSLQKKKRFTCFNLTSILILGLNNK